MANVATIETLAELIDQLGGIPLERIRFRPAPGTATEQDVIEVEARDNRLCELVDGVLVEKAMGYSDSILAGLIIRLLGNYVGPRNLGYVSGADGMMRLFPGLIRMPDVAFASWACFPDGILPEEPAPDLAPDLAIEVLSRGNTPREMERKRREYFDAGVQLVWMVDPRARTVTVFSSPDAFVELAADQKLDGGDVLPGFTLALPELFAELDRQAD